MRPRMLGLVSASIPSHLPRPEIVSLKPARAPCAPYRGGLSVSADVGRGNNTGTEGIGHQRGLREILLCVGLCTSLACCILRSGGKARSVHRCQGRQRAPSPSCLPT